MTTGRGGTPTVFFVHCILLGSLKIWYTFLRKTCSSSLFRPQGPGCRLAEYPRDENARNFQSLLNYEAWDDEACSFDAVVPQSSSVYVPSFDAHHTSATATSLLLLLSYRSSSTYTTTTTTTTTTTSSTPGPCPLLTFHCFALALRAGWHIPSLHCDLGASAIA